MKNIPYHLFLDDNRQPKDVKWLELPLYNWIVVKTYKEFVETIKRDGVPTTVSFDHDLYSEHYAVCNDLQDERLICDRRIPYEKFKEKTGYDAAIWLVNHCIDNNVPLPHYYVHTLNPVGRQNILSVMESARKVINENNIGKKQKHGLETI